MSRDIDSQVQATQVTETEPLLGRSRNGGGDGGGTKQRPNDDAILDDGSEQTPALDLKLETALLFRYSWPLICTYLLQYSFSLVTVFVASQLSTDELAGVSLGITTSNIIGYAIFEGMATGLDTLCSQAFGASRLTDVGMITIRGTILLWLVAIPIGLLWMFAEPLLVLLVPSRALAEHAGSFLRFSLIGVPGYASFESGKRFMQAQGNFTAGLVVLLVCLPLNVGLTYLLVHTADMRVEGAALAASLNNLLRPVLLVLYALIIDRSTLQCWPSSSELRNWSQHWGHMVNLAVSGALMTLSEWLGFEIVTFGTSYVGNASLAAQTFLSSATVIVWHIPFSASVACSTRIGQLVGAGRMQTTLRLTRWYAFFFLGISLFSGLLTVGIILLMLQLLVHDSDVAVIVLAATPHAALFAFFDATSSWAHSIVRGLGWQNLGAIVTVSVNYLYAVPLSLFLELGPPKLGISGLWLGLGSGLAIITVVEGFIANSRLREQIR